MFRLCVSFSLFLSVNVYVCVCDVNEKKRAERLKICSEGLCSRRLRL